MPTMQRIPGSRQRNLSPPVVWRILRMRDWTRDCVLNPQLRQMMSPSPISKAHCGQRWPSSSLVMTYALPSSSASSPGEGELGLDGAAGFAAGLSGAEDLAAFGGAGLLLLADLIARGGGGVSSSSSSSTTAAFRGARTGKTCSHFLQRIFLPKVDSGTFILRPHSGQEITMVSID